MDPDYIFSLFLMVFLAYNLTTSKHSQHLRGRKSKRVEHSGGSVKVETETILGLLYEYQLTYASAPHNPHFALVNILLARTCVCLCLHASYRHVFLTILRFSVFYPAWLVRSLSPTVTLSYGALLSLHLYLSCHVLLPSAHHNVLPFMIFHYIHSEVCLHKCPCSPPPPPLLTFLYRFLSLFYRFLSICPLIPTH